MDEPGLTGFGLIATGEYEPFQLWEFPFFVLVGIAGGIIGATYNQIAFYLIKFRGRFLTKTYLRTIEVLFIATLTCILFYSAPLFVGKCVDIPTECKTESTDDKDICGDMLIKFNCPEGQYSQMATLTFTSLDNVAHSQFHGEADLGTGCYFYYLFLSFFFNVYSMGLAVPAGIFVPNIAIGSIFGRLIGRLARQCDSYFNTPIFPGVYAVLGSASMLAGTGRIAVALIAIMLETTGSVLYIIPLVIVIMTSKWIGDLLNISIYDITIELRPMPFVEPQPMIGYQQLEARDLMSYPVMCFQQHETIGHIMEMIFPKNEEEKPHNGFPVVNENNKLIGLILRNHLIIILKNYDKIFMDQNQDISTGKLSILDFATKMSSRVLGTKQEDLPNKNILDLNRHKRINLGVYMNACPYTVYANSKLTKVFRLYRGMALRHVPVINLENEVVGIITRKELMTDFQQDLT
eukprot:TRINITY_DN1897_c0_g1_i14.p1 TRINITY_DN1897_c0_g1~~TRINITY_DN1897_c0_g1_i14.p1  ORF type:complete len:463 (-),score=49.41 TRINITY_DN1897_c0_g1_i14:183-1571(-)